MLSKQEGIERKINIATILVGIVCKSCVIACALIAGILVFNLGASLLLKIMGVLSVTRALAKFIEIGVFAESISRRNSKKIEEEENMVMSILNLFMGLGFFMSGMGVINACSNYWLLKMGMISAILGGVDIINSLCSLILPIVKKGQKEENIFGNTFYNKNVEEERDRIDSLNLKINGKEEQITNIEYISKNKIFIEREDIFNDDRKNEKEIFYFKL